MSTPTLAATFERTNLSVAFSKKPMGLSTGHQIAREIVEKDTYTARATAYMDTTSARQAKSAFIRDTTQTIR